MCDIYGQNLCFTCHVHFHTEHNQTFITIPSGYGIFYQIKGGTGMRVKSCEGFWFLLYLSKSVREPLD